MIKKVCFLSNYSGYEAKRYFTQKLNEAFLRAGVESWIISAKDGVLSEDDIMLLKKEKPDFTATFNSLLPLKNGQFLSEILHIPHLAMLLDPSIYVMKLIKSPYSIVSCVDKFDCQLLRDIGFLNVFFLPLGVEKDLEHNPSADRPLDVVFMGSCYDYETLRESWEQKYPHSICRAIEVAIEIALSDTSVHFLQALTEAWSVSKLDPFGIDFLNLAYYVDYYSRGVDRVELLRAVKDVTLHVYGELSIIEGNESKGWDYYLSGKKNVIIHPPVIYEQSLEILKQTKVSLNSIPFFRNGPHDRIFNGLVAGNLVVSTENLYVRKNFGENEGILMYRYKEWDKINDLLEPYFKDENKRVVEVTKGQQKVLQHHTWDNRVQTMLKEIPLILDRIYEDNVDIHI